MLWNLHFLLLQIDGTRVFLWHSPSFRPVLVNVLLVTWSHEEFLLLFGIAHLHRWPSPAGTACLPVSVSLLSHISCTSWLPCSSNVANSQVQTLLLSSSQPRLPNGVIWRAFTNPSAQAHLRLLSVTPPGVGLRHQDLGQSTSWSLCEAKAENHGSSPASVPL